MDRDEADEILIPHSLWNEDEAEYASGTGTEEASEEEDEVLKFHLPHLYP